MTNTLPASIVIAGVIIAGGIFLDVDGKVYKENKFKEGDSFSLSINWGDLGKKMSENGTIDIQMLPYATEFDNKKIVITQENAGRLLNILWALGLSSKNPILEEGEMTDPRYGGPENFASTAGWTVAKGDAMDHYSMHSYLELTEDEQERVDKVSRTIYRPCCSNSAHFPDCNHGMAMLGLLELLASEGYDEKEMEKIAHTVNAFWFPEFYDKEPVKSSGCSISIENKKFENQLYSSFLLNRKNT